MRGQQNCNYDKQQQGIWEKMSSSRSHESNEAATTSKDDMDYSRQATKSQKSATAVLQRSSTSASPRPKPPARGSAGHAPDVKTSPGVSAESQSSDINARSAAGAGTSYASQQSSSDTASIRRQAAIKRPMRAGAKSLDQSNQPRPSPPTSRPQAPVKTTATRQSQDQHAKETASTSSKPVVGHQKQQQQEQRESSQPGSLMAVEEDDCVDNSVLVETADDEELVADSSSGGPGGNFAPSLTASLTRNLIWAVFASTVGSSFQHGYNGGVVNAPERLIGEWINSTYSKRHGEPATEAQIDLIMALIVSIFCVGGCLGALLTAFVADRIGRKEGLMYNNILVLIAAPMMASAQAASSYELLILGRFIIGINAGLNAGLAPLYLNEIAPIRLRGALGTIYQLVITISILASNIFGMPGLLGDADSWPILFVIPIIPAAFMLITLPHLCESPKFLILRQGREFQAQQALAWLRETGDVMEEMDVLRTERELITLQQRPVSLADMLSDTCLRKPLTIAVVIMLSQQFSGINAVLFYSTSIFRDAGLSGQAAVSATLGMSAVNVAMTLVSLFLVDRAGRRTLHMTGLMGMAAACLVLAFCLGGGPGGPSTATGPSAGLAVVAIYVFIAMFASGPGAIPWFLVAELFPSNARPLATSIAVAVNWLANFSVSLCFLPLSNVLHGFTFVLFAILLVIFYLFTYYKVPETKGATAEEISVLFRR